MIEDLTPRFSIAIEQPLTTDELRMLYRAARTLLSAMQQGAFKVSIALYRSDGSMLDEPELDDMLSFVAEIPALSITALVFGFEKHAKQPITPNTPH